MSFCESISEIKDTCAFLSKKLASCNEGISLLPPMMDGTLAQPCFLCVEMLVRIHNTDLSQSVFCILNFHRLMQSPLSVTPVASRTFRGK